MTGNIRILGRNGLLEGLAFERKRFDGRVQSLAGISTTSRWRHEFALRTEPLARVSFACPLFWEAAMKA